MNRKQHLMCWLVCAISAVCIVPFGLHIGANCAEMYMAWCNAHPQIALVLAGLVLVLVLGSVLLGIRAGVSQVWRTRRVFNSLRAAITAATPPKLQEVSRQLGLTNRIDLVEMTVPFACCYGLLWPRIAVTTGLLKLLTADELKAVVQHEQAHLQRYDPLRTWLWTICDGIWWWAPGANEESRVVHELAADWEVIRAGGRQALARALLKLIEYSQQSRALSGNLAISPLSVPEARIDHLLQPHLAVPRNTIAVSSRIVPLIGIVILALCVWSMAGILA